MKICAAAIAALMLTTSAHACGIERWPVKIAADFDAGLINKTPIAATVAELGALPAPRDPMARSRSRFTGELAIYTVHAILKEVRHEADGDYHLILADPELPTATMIAEAPDPACDGGSVFAAKIKAVRQAIDAKLQGPIATYTRPNIAVTVTGDLFFDKPHRQIGVAPNAAELHPLINFAAK